MLVKTVILAGARTPFGKFQGGLSSFTASELGGFAIQGALEKANVAPDQVEEVIIGSVLQAGQGQIPSRQAAHNAGIPWSTPTETINKVCASGMRAVTLADQLIRLGEKSVIVAGGMESMSNAPYYLLEARNGLRMGNSQTVDGMIYDGLSCSFDVKKPHMGTYGNKNAEQLNITREEQDAWSVRSHELAAQSKGKFAEEIVPVQVPQRKGEPIVVAEDESVRPGTTLETLQKLRSAFSADGTITAGNAPGVNDGACALVLASDEYAKENGLEPMATIVAHAAIGVEPEKFPQTPAIVVEELVKKAGKSLNDIDLFEMNEAFAAVALIGQKLTGIDPEKINVNGGAVALGHPIGASGARIILTLAHELKRRGGGLGIAAICSGGGQGDAVLIEV
ncbi:MAG: acetyl-CoA C-acetyltransferase [Lysinibacillus sp.]